MSSSEEANPYELDLDKNSANYAPLTPLGFIERTAYVYPDRTAVIHGARRTTWAQTMRVAGDSPPRSRGAG